MKMTDLQATVTFRDSQEAFEEAIKRGWFSERQAEQWMYMGTYDCVDKFKSIQTRQYLRPEWVQGTAEHASAQAEATFIEAEQSKLDTKLRRQLRKVDATGEIGREASETLWLNGLIQFGGPRVGNPYNCYRLTDQGHAVLNA